MTSRPHAPHPEPPHFFIRVENSPDQTGVVVFWCLSTCWTECIFPAFWADVSFQTRVTDKQSWIHTFVKLNCFFESFTVICCKVLFFCAQNPHWQLPCRVRHSRRCPCDGAADKAGGVDGSRVKWTWSAISASLSVSLVCSIVRNSGGCARCGSSPLDSGRELGFSLLDLQDASALELAPCASRRRADLSDKFAWHFHLIPESISLTLNAPKSPTRRNDFNNFCHHIVLPG